MNYDIENMNDPMYREYIDNLEDERLEEERNLLLEEEFAQEDEEFAIREEERLTAMEGFNPINSDVLIEDGVIQERILENDELYNFEKEKELEEDLDIIQEGRDPIW